MSGTPIELNAEECLARLHEHFLGRIALATQEGPRIVPVNYAMDGESVVVRTSPYSELAGQPDGCRAAFEIDEFDFDRRRGWSVVAHGWMHRLTDADEVARIQRGWDPEPWAEGARNLYLRVSCDTLTGRRLGGRHDRADQVAEPAVDRTA